MRRSTATTLQDVAKEVGVATITVSVVLNGSRSATRVSDATRARIVEAAKRLNYRPNGVARGLTRRRMDTVGVVSRFSALEVNTYFIEVLSGILEASARCNQNTTIISLTNWPEEQDRVLQFCDGRIDGLILVAPHDITEGFPDKLLHYAPYIVMHSNSDFTQADSIDADNEGGYFAVVKHLTDLGHRRIAHFAGEQKLLGARQRLDGYKRALASAGIAFDDRLIFPGDFDAPSGRENTRDFLTRYSQEERPTAIACVNDTVAFSCVEILTQHQISVPQDVSVVGFDDTALSKMSVPPLTTVRQPLREMGGYAVDRLLLRINESLSSPKAAVTTPSPSTVGGGEPVNVPPEIWLAAPHMELFSVSLIVRGSTGPPSRKL